ncbi:MAG TPA: hypothetical protein VJU86_03740 [Pyrinomonadaceae bacterium]|nr:hypothetical protein [Pyrinomonadaceae bacterium]
MKTVFIAGSAVCVVAAVILLLRQQLDAAFVVATIGVVAWFLSYRVKMKQIIAENDPEIARGEDINEGADN